MKKSWSYKLRSFILPGLKRWILFILIGIITIVLGVLLLLDEHPIRSMLDFLEKISREGAQALPSKISGIIALGIGAVVTSIAVGKLVLSVVGSFVPTDRESIPDALFRRRHLERGPRVVVIGGGTGLSNLLKGLKGFTNNITAIVTVGDDGGSSGKLRQELGVLPPGDIRNCITALADEEKLVTELFRYRFQQGSGLEGHAFGNLFLSAVCAINNGDMLEAAKAASKVLNSCGQVLPSTLQGMTLIAELENGEIIRGESHISASISRIVKLRSEPESPEPTPAALAAISEADFIVIGPGSLYTSVIPNLLVNGIPEAIMKSTARKIYVCNVMTQKGETTGFTVGDHVNALLRHAGYENGSQLGKKRFVDRVLCDNIVGVDLRHLPANTVKFDRDELRPMGVKPTLREVGSSVLPGHHDPEKLAAALMLWYTRNNKRRSLFARPPKSPPKPPQKPPKPPQIAATLNM